MGTINTSVTNNQFNGYPYPIQEDPRGYFYPQGGLNQIQSDLLQLILTNPGERVMLPTFGTDLRSLFFEINDSITTTLAQQRVTASIAMWEPRVVINAITVTTNVDSNILSPSDNGTEANHILTIQISFYDPQNIGQIQNLVLQVPLGAGG